ncbi:MAG: beta-N-acetylglucosaminidase domain-containing protein [Limisphaerales bacterium]
MKTKLIIAAGCLIAAGCYAQPTNAPEDIATSSLQVHLPATARPFPEPLPPSQQPGFKFRGAKGWAWTPKQYLEEIPWLVKFKMNFLMNCYTSLFSSTHPWINEWWKPLPDAKKAAYAKVIRSCQTNGIIFCFCMNPQKSCKRPLNPTNAEDLDLLFRHYAWAQSQGVKWFSICVDDVKWTQAPTEIAVANAKMVNTVLARLRKKDPEAQMIFCPGPYWGNGTKPKDHAYLQILAHDLNPDVHVFWTGNAGVTPHITMAAAESYKKAVGHRLFLWDNYPVNDGSQTLNLGPINGRTPDLGEIVDGYISNPMEPQNQINHIPLATCADYAYNPRAYNPQRSIGQAILLFGKNHAQREVLKQLIEAYPGFIAAGGGTGTNPVRNKFKKLAAESDSRAARQFLDQIERLSNQFEEEFPNQFSAAQKTVAADVTWMKAH